MQGIHTSPCLVVPKKQKPRNRHCPTNPVPDFAAEEEFPALSRAKNTAPRLLRPSPVFPCCTEAVSCPVQCTGSKVPYWTATSANEVDTDTSTGGRTRGAKTDAETPAIRRSRHPKKSKVVLLADLVGQVSLLSSGQRVAKATNARQVGSTAATTKGALRCLSAILHRIVAAPHDERRRTVPECSARVQAIQTFPRVYQLFLRCGFRKVPTGEHSVFLMPEDSVSQLPEWLRVVESQIRDSGKVTNMASDPLLHGTRGKERRTPRKKRVSRLKRIVVGDREGRQADVLSFVRAAVASCEPGLPLPSFQLFDVKCALRVAAPRRPACALTKDTPAAEVLTLIDEQLALLANSVRCNSLEPSVLNPPKDDSVDNATSSTLSNSDTEAFEAHPMSVPMCNRETQTTSAEQSSEGTGSTCPWRSHSSQATQTALLVTQDVGVGADGLFYRRRPRAVPTQDRGVDARGVLPMVCLGVQCMPDGPDGNGNDLDTTDVDTNHVLGPPAMSHAIVQTVLPTVAHTPCQTDSALLDHVTHAYGLHPLRDLLDRRGGDTLLPPAAQRPPIREYCRAVLTDHVDAVAEELLELLAKFQKRTLHDPNKRRLRRYVVGLRQAAKGLAARRCRMVLLAPNVEKAEASGGLDSLVHRILALAEAQQVPMVFCLQRRKLGRVLGITHGVSAVAVFSADGAHAQYKQLCALSQEAAAEYGVVVAQAAALRQAAELRRQEAEARARREAEERARQAREAREAAKWERVRAHEEAQAQARQAKLERVAARQEARAKEQAEARAQAAAAKAARAARSGRPQPPVCNAGPPLPWAGPGAATAPGPTWPPHGPMGAPLPLNPGAVPWYPYAYCHCDPPAPVHYR